MPYVAVGRENSGDIELYYEDHGSGKPVVLIHGWPLSGRILGETDGGAARSGLPRHHLRPPRASGKSSKPTFGYEYDTLRRRPARSPDGRSTSGTPPWWASPWAAARSPATWASTAPSGCSKAAFVAAIPPFLLKTADNPEGVDGAVFDGIKKGHRRRPAGVSGRSSSRTSTTSTSCGGKRVSDELVRLSWNIAVGASPTGTLRLRLGLADRLPEGPREDRLCPRWSCTATPTASFRWKCPDAARTPP